MAATSESANVFPAARRASSVPVSMPGANGDAPSRARGASTSVAVRALRDRLDEAAAAECAAERLTHPLEILMDSPRVVRALGVAVPLLAEAAWRVAGAVCAAATHSR